MSQVPPPHPPAEPGSGRLPAVDALRALALLGILLVNIRFFADPALLEAGRPGTATTAETSLADQLVAFTVTTVVEAKAYVVFSFLFGLSFVHQQAAARRAGASETARTLRRMLVLAVLGVMHGVLLFAGDILLTYAILGVLLLGLRGLRPRTALALAVVVAAGYGLLLFGLGAAPPAPGASGADPSPPSSEATAALAAYTGSPAEYLSFQASRWAALAPAVLLGQGVIAWAAMSAGLAVARLRLIERVLERSVPTARLITVMVLALLLGTGLSATAARIQHGAPGAPAVPAPQEALLAAGLSVLAGPVQAAGGVILVLLVLRSRAGSGLLAVLAPAGRTALTNYLGQSLVLALLFSGPGLGLAGQLTALPVAGIAVGLWLLQLPASALWMRRFRAGPLEIPLRAITYADRHADRRRAAPPPHRAAAPRDI